MEDVINWQNENLKKNVHTELKIGMKVIDCIGNSGIIVKILEDTIYVWQEDKHEYGSDNCEHYDASTWKSILRILDTDAVKPEDSLDEVIVCSAAMNPRTQEVYLSLRHGDNYFWKHHDDQRGAGVSCMDYIQGFVTNKRRFVDRKEAYIIAKNNNQIRRLCPTGSNKLYSEMLY